MTEIFSDGSGASLMILDVNNSLDAKDITACGWTGIESSHYERRRMLCYEKNNTWLMIHKESNAAAMMMRDPSKQIELFDMFNTSIVFAGYIRTQETLVTLEKILMI